MSLQSRFQVAVKGESGQNELLRETLALVGVHSSTRLVKYLVKYRWTPRFPAQLILPSSPGERIDGTEDSAQVVARPLACGLLVVSCSKGEETLVAATACNCTWK